MKILAINSSFKGNMGSSKFLIDKLFEGARGEGAECENINLVELKINHCIDCQVCQKPDHFLKCIYNDKDDVAMIYNKMREADIIIFATPVYTFGMSSLLKMLLERYYGTSEVGKFHFTKSGLFFHHVDNDICRKPFVTLVVCDNPEDETPKNIVSFFKTYSKFMDAEMVGTLVRKSAGMIGFSQEEKCNNPVIVSVYNAYILAGRELATLERISKRTEKKANEPMVSMPFFVKSMLKLGFGREKIVEAHEKMLESIIKRV